MWLFFFSDSEHKKLSNSSEKLKSYIRKRYDYTTWSFNYMDSNTIQVLDKDDNEQGFIVWVGIV